MVNLTAFRGKVSKLCARNLTKDKMLKGQKMNFTNSYSKQADKITRLFRGTFTTSEEADFDTSWFKKPARAGDVALT